MSQVILETVSKKNFISVLQSWQSSKESWEKIKNDMLLYLSMGNMTGIFNENPVSTFYQLKENGEILLLIILDSFTKIDEIQYVIKNPKIQGQVFIKFMDVFEPKRTIGLSPNNSKLAEFYKKFGFKECDASLSNFSPNYINMVRSFGDTVTYLIKEN